MTLLWVVCVVFALIVLSMAFYPLYQSTAKKQVVLLGAAVLVASFGLYALWGSPRVVPLVTAHHERLDELRQTIQLSEALIKQNPQNLEAWLTLAQAFADSGDYKAAANGYKQTVLLSKGNPQLIMAYAEALIMQNDGAIDASAKKSIDIALMIDPALPVARYYYARWLLQEGQMEDAMKTMKTLYHELPDDSPLKRKIDAQIGR